MRIHRLHIEDEGRNHSAIGSRHNMRPYCECGWLGERERALDTQVSRQNCRDQFYDHLQEMGDRPIPGGVI